MYHRFVSPGRDDRRLLGAEMFERQLRYIGRHHEAWDPDRQMDHVEGNHAAPHKPAVVLTIDDGYLDFYEVAFPLLKTHGVPATLFVTTGFVAGRTWFWWDRLTYVLQNCGTGVHTFETQIGPVTGDPSLPQDRARIWLAVTAPKRFVSDREKEDAITEFARRYGVEIPEQPPHDFAAVSWQQIHEMRQHGVTVGAHTVTHPILSRVTREEAAAEINDSRRDLTAQGIEPVDWFCYPQGGPLDFTPETVELVRDAGYRGSYTTFGIVDHDGDPMTLPRYGVSDNYRDFRWLMCGAEYLFLRLKSLLGRDTGVGDYYWTGYDNKSGRNE
jgi:Polysaccharide deacetylase